MINVSEAFKYAVKQPSKQIAAYLTDGIDAISDQDDLKSFKITTEGSFLRTFMRRAEAFYLDTHDYVGSYVNLGVRVRLPQIDSLGTFTVTIADPAVVTLTAHGLSTGAKVYLTTTGSLPTGLTEAFYWVINVTVNTLSLAASYQDAMNNIAITTTGSQSGTHSMASYPAGATDGNETIDYGSFIVISEETNEASDEVKIKMFDKMYESLQKYDFTDEITYPTTVLGLLQAICTRFSWDLATGSDSFPNSSLPITAELFSNQQLTFRNVLDWIAETAASIIYFNVDDELVVRQIAHDTPLDTLDASTLLNLKISPKWGEVNSVVLSRFPQEDNILDQDEDSITDNGLTEVKIVNNQIVDSVRETAVEPIFDELFGLELYPFELSTTGLGYFEVGDRVILKNPAGTERASVVMFSEIYVGAGFKDTLKCPIPDKTSTNYDTAGIVGQSIRNTQIVVDKQNGVIQIINEQTGEAIAQIQLTTEQIESSVESLNSQISDITTQITTLQQTAEALELSIQGVGGTNLLVNSVGLKGSLAEWQELNTEGEPIDPDNNGFIDQGSDVSLNSESKSAIVLEEQFIRQTFPVIAGNLYTVYFRYKSVTDTDLIITGESTNVLEDTDGDWEVFKYQFTPSVSTITVEFSNTAYSSSSTSLTDVLVKLGDASGWVQAPNEVYGTNYRFDREGFLITSDTSSFKSLLDNQQLAVFDTSGGSDRIIMLVSRDRATLTGLTTQDDFILQRYENPARGMKMIPTDTGILIIITPDT